jgi:hypothetical protein
MLPLRFVADHQVAGIANVVVDGSPNADTVLTLSHWPGMPTPPELRADLSAEIAFRALERPALFDRAEAVTNNHFDQDGLAGIFALVHPDVAERHRDLLIDIARAGDFGWFRSRDAARIAMAIAALDDDATSPLPADVLASPYPDRCASLYEWALPRLGAVLDDPTVWQHLWADEDALLTDGLAAIASRAVAIDERPSVDLAIVTVPDSLQANATHRFTMMWSSAVHPMAINGATDALRILLIQGRHYSLELRYESWVMLTSRVVVQRPDLRVLADELNAIEPPGARWHADPPGALTPKLVLVDNAESGLAQPALIAAVEHFLATAPSAWNPFTPSVI